MPMIVNILGWSLAAVLLYILIALLISMRENGDFIGWRDKLKNRKVRRGKP